MSEVRAVPTLWLTAAANLLAGTAVSAVAQVVLFGIVLVTYVIVPGGHELS